MIRLFFPFFKHFFFPPLIMDLYQSKLRKWENKIMKEEVNEGDRTRRNKNYYNLSIYILISVSFN